MGAFFSSISDCALAKEQIVDHRSPAFVKYVGAYGQYQQPPEIKRHCTPAVKTEAGISDTVAILLRCMAKPNEVC